MAKKLVGMFSPFDEEGKFNSQALYDSIMDEAKEEGDEDKE